MEKQDIEKMDTWAKRRIRMDICVIVFIAIVIGCAIFINEQRLALAKVLVFGVVAILSSYLFGAVVDDGFSLRNKLKFGRNENRGRIKHRDDDNNSR